MKHYVIGDVHGCFLTLKKLISTIGEQNNFFCIGDLIDKGPKSKEVIDLCLKNNIKSIRGNHEHLFIIYIEKYLNNENIINSNWIKEWGGKNTLESYREDKKLLKEHLEYLKLLPLYRELKIKEETFFLSHGFGLPYYHLKENYEKSHRPIMSNRPYSKYFNINDKENLKKLKDHNVINIFGHEAFKEVFYHEDLYYGIDTGCVYGKTFETKGHLTAMCLEDKSFVSIECIDEVSYI